MENEFHEQLFGSTGGLVFNQADAEDVGDYDAESKLRCPACECGIPAAEHCIYCDFNLVDWILSMTQSSATQRITETMQEMRNGGY